MTAFNADPAFRFPGQARQNGGLFGRVLAIAAGEHQTHDDFIYRFLFDAGPPDSLGYHKGSEFGRAQIAQGPVKVSQRCSHRTDNHRCFH